MKTIPLTQNKVAIVDDEDYERLIEYKWYAHFDGSNFYARRSERPHGKKNIVKIKTIPMHRMILTTVPSSQIDHINGNTLDNRRENLRAVSIRENTQNRKIKYASKYPGVSKNKNSKTNPWRARIHYNGKDYLLGYFKNEEEAYECYKQACVDIENDKFFKGEIE